MNIIAIDPGNIDSAFVDNLKTKNYVVYMHVTPNGKKYIGITQLNLNDRFRKGKGYKSNMYFTKAINKYGWDNIQHLVIAENLSFEEAGELESKLIYEHDSANKRFGYNICFGGEQGALGIKRSPETLIKMRKANLGKIMSEETKKRISNSLKGRQFTPEHREKKKLAQIGIKNHRFGTKASGETRMKMSNSQPKGINKKQSKAINQFTLSRELIKTWDSMGDIYRELNINHCMISDCCRMKQKTSNGFIWEYAN